MPSLRLCPPGLPIEYCRITITITILKIVSPGLPIGCCRWRRTKQTTQRIRGTSLISDHHHHNHHFQHHVHHCNQTGVIGVIIIIAITLGILLSSTLLQTSFKQVRKTKRYTMIFKAKLSKLLPTNHDIKCLGHHFGLSLKSVVAWRCQIRSDWAYFCPI